MVSKEYSQRCCAGSGSDAVPLLILVGALSMSASGCFIPPCEIETSASASAPNGGLLAIAYEKGCGATSPLNTRVDREVQYWPAWITRHRHGGQDL